MYLTEQEQLDEKQELLYTILEDFIEENYEVKEDHVMTEQEELTLSAILEHFLEQYKEPTLNQAVIESVTGKGINDELFEELSDVLLDESLGGLVAGAKHGIKNWLLKHKAKSATAEKEKAKSDYQRHLAPGGKKTKADLAQAKHDKTNYGSGILGHAKKAYHQAKISRAQEKATAAKAKMKAAETKRKSAAAKHQSGVAKSSALAKKIDTKVKTGLTNLATKAGTVAGKLAG